MGSSVRVDDGTSPIAGVGAAGEPAPRRNFLAFAVGVLATVAAGSAYWLGSTLAGTGLPVVTGVAVAAQVVVPMAVGMAWSWRRPESGFGVVLVALGLAAWLLALEPANGTPVDAVSGVGEALFLALGGYALLAFPGGSLRAALDRWLVALVAVAGLALALPGDASRVAAATCLGAGMGIVGVLASRCRAAAGLRRRMLAAALVSALLYLPVLVSVVAGAVGAGGDEGWIVLGARVLFPVGFLVALVQAEIYAWNSVRRLLEDLNTGPEPGHRQRVISEALGDPGFRLGYWAPRVGRYIDSTGATLEAPETGSGRRRVEFAYGGRRFAAMDMDEALAGEPGLVGAAGAAVRAAAQQDQLERELRASLARVAGAGDDERRRIARDLHDSAQQRLVALRMHLSLATEWLDRPEEQAMVEELGKEIDDALDELRNFTYGLYPAVLGQRGVAVALRSAAQRAPVLALVDDHGLRRHREPVERTIFFCVMEALQNAVKHAGPETTVTIKLWESPGEVRFEVDDTGPGFDPAKTPRGAGLANMEDRLTSVGGSLELRSAPGQGARVIGRIPLTADLPPQLVARP